MTYSVVGMGAIGGYYGGQLANAGREVHFLSHSDYEHVLHHGLQVDSCNGNFHLPHINAYGASKDMPKTDDYHRWSEVGEEPRRAARAAAPDYS